LMQNVVMPNGTYAECRKQARFAECRYAECCSALVRLSRIV